LTIFVLVQVMKCVSKPMPTKYLAMGRDMCRTLLSLCVIVEILRQTYLGSYSLFSQSIDLTPAGLPMASVLWVFYVSKVPELLDTVLLALERNFNQITFSHVYRHSSFFIVWWFIISYVSGALTYFMFGFTVWILCLHVIGVVMLCSFLLKCYSAIATQRL
jgi:elongation of very long chain fatty acids protein 4